MTSSPEVPTSRSAPLVPTMVGVSSPQVGGVWAPAGAASAKTDTSMDAAATLQLLRRIRVVRVVRAVPPSSDCA
jgi:hypothetical protein